jgi:rRNA maturation endonuclease Nob1
MNTIIERIKGWKEYELQKLRQFISLVMLTESNYYHIQELETVKELLESFKNAYYNEYYPNISIAAEIACKIAETTRAAHYDNKLKSDDYHLSNVLTGIGIDFSYIINTQTRYDKYHKAGSNLF